MGKAVLAAAKDAGVDDKVHFCVRIFSLVYSLPLPLSLSLSLSFARALTHSLHDRCLMTQLHMSDKPRGV